MDVLFNQIIKKKYISKNLCTGFCEIEQISSLYNPPGFLEILSRFIFYFLNYKQDQAVSSTSILSNKRTELMTHASESGMSRPSANPGGKGCFLNIGASLEANQRYLRSHFNQCQSPDSPDSKGVFDNAMIQEGRSSKKHVMTLRSPIVSTHHKTA